MRGIPTRVHENSRRVAAAGLALGPGLTVGSNGWVHAVPAAGRVTARRISGSAFASFHNSLKDFDGQERNLNTDGLD